MKQMAVAFFLLSGFAANAQQWTSDFDQALQEAKDRDRNILLFFSVSEACDLCRRLDNVVFRSEEFLEYASSHLVLAKFDFSNSIQSGSKPDQLLIVEKYNKDGFFPWVVLVGKTGKIVGKAPLYEDQGASRYLEQLKSLNGG